MQGEAAITAEEVNYLMEALVFPVPATATGAGRYYCPPMPESGR